MLCHLAGLGRTHICIQNFPSSLSTELLPGFSSLCLACIDLKVKHINQALNFSVLFNTPRFPAYVFVLLPTRGKLKEQRKMGRVQRWRHPGPSRLVSCGSKKSSKTMYLCRYQRAKNVWQQLLVRSKMVSLLVRDVQADAGRYQWKDLWALRIDSQRKFSYMAFVLVSSDCYTRNIIDWGT